MELILEPHPAWIGGRPRGLETTVKFYHEDSLPATVTIPRLGADSLIYKRSGDRYRLWGIETQKGVREGLSSWAIEQLERLASEQEKLYRGRY